MHLENKLPFGIDPLYDVKHILEEYTVKTIIDVGANIGQSAASFIKHFPTSVIHCIEPINPTFNELQLNTRQYPNVTCHNIAFGQTGSTVDVKIPAGKRSTQISLKNVAENDSFNHTIQPVIIKTLATFCREENIFHIDYLKIDTEGYDLEVLKGGSNLLANHTVGIIEVEAGMNPANKLHVSLFDLTGYLEQKHYYLFGIYEQSQEWKQNKPMLRRANLLFISRLLVENTNNNNSRFNRIDMCNIGYDH